MSEFFLELFSEEIPANLQKNAREIVLQNFKNFFEKENINFAKCSSFSTPNRLIILFEEVDKEILRKTEEVRGPNVNAPEKALEGFLKSIKMHYVTKYPKTVSLIDGIKQKIHVDKKSGVEEFEIDKIIM